MAETKAKEVKFGRGRGPAGPKPQLKNPGKTFGRLMKESFGRYIFISIIVAVCLLASNISTVVGMTFIKTLIEDYIKPLTQTSTPDYKPLLFALATMGTILGIGAIASYVQGKLMIYVTQGTLKRLRIQLFDHMEKLPISYFDTHSHGDIMSIYTNDVDTLRQLISQSIPNMIGSLVTIVTVLISMIILSWRMTLIMLVMVVVILFITKSVAGKSGSYFVSQQKQLGAVNGYIEEMIGGQKVVKVFTHEDEAIENFDKLNGDLFNVASKANRFVNILGPINAQLGNLTYVVCSIAGGALAMGNIGGFTLGAMASFLLLIKSFLMPINQISQQFNMIVMALAGAERVFGLLDEPVEVDEGYVTLVNAAKEDGVLKESEKRTGLWAWKHFHKAEGTTTYVELKGDVVFDDVDFGYTDEKMVLHNIDLYATPGQKIAFVGSTGAGKTTITNLINRFYDIQDGKIRYDGINVNKIKKSDLRRSLGIVLQDTHLFSGTVMDNIRYGKLDATDEEVIAAAKLANAHSFISRLPQGYNTVIKADGGSLSQGQRQLLAIARAAIADPPVLILDEATSSIDTRTEKLVQAGMDGLMKGRTTFVIAHRLSTVKNSDCIIVLEKGRIIERGTHDELLAAKGKYYALYTGNQVTA